MDARSSASKTALMVCAYRARASRQPRPLIHDPWAEALAGAAGHELATRYDARFPAMELWLALRVAYLDRLVGLAVDRLGARQIVLLGAGYDTRAARLPRAGVRFFEVDHPATQAEKRRRLAALDGYPITAATYVACDFEGDQMGGLPAPPLAAEPLDSPPRASRRADDLIDALCAAGLDATAPALVIWEGVVPYLTEAAVRATTTRLAAGLDPRSLVAFDYLGKGFAAGTKLAPADLDARSYVGELGEPIRFGSDDILPLLAGAGLRWVRTLDFNELALELVSDYQRDRKFRFQRIALAAVRAPGAGWP